MFKRLSIAFAALALLLAVPAFGQSRPMGPGPGGPHVREEAPDPARQVERMKHALDLTEEQVQQMEQLVEGVAETRPQQRERMLTLRADLRMLEQAGSFDEPAARDVARQLAEIHANQLVDRARMMSEMRSILTSDQLSRLNELQSSRAKRRQPRKRP